MGTASRRESRPSGRNPARPQQAANGNKDRDSTGAGEGGSGVHPPTIIFKDRLYVLADRRGRPRPRAFSARAPAAKSGRVRPYVKGTFRVYSSRFPHLAPVPPRRKRRRASVPR